MKVEPQAEHRWLEKLAGEWTSEWEASPGEGQPPRTFRGTLSARVLGGVWLLAEGRNEEPDGSTSTTVMTLGYDPVKGRFVGTFVATMMPYLWVYDGALNAAGTALELDATGPSFSGDGSMQPYRDTVEIAGDDHWVLRSSQPGGDGAWEEFMSMHYHRAA
ncbi:MAG TPA: DUF1579 domain-containing protein [Longimicrobium sp.]|nr:DUF1579 domain-containing protein [Longimicrobium sp.]